MKSVPSPHLSTKQDVLGAFPPSHPYSISPSLVRLSPFPMAQTQLLSNPTVHTQWVGQGSCTPGSLLLLWKITPTLQGKMHKRWRGAYHLIPFALRSCQSAHRALLSPQETLDSGGTICPHEGSRLPGPCHSPSLWDCPRGLLHWYWGADLKVLRVEIAGAQVPCHLSSPFDLD